MSSFYSPEGIQVEAPVFNELPRLPTPLGSFLYTSPYFRFMITFVPHFSRIFSRDSSYLSICPLLGFSWNFARLDDQWLHYSVRLTSRVLIKYPHLFLGGRNLSVVDRLTALPLIQALLEFDAV